MKNFEGRKVRLFGVLLNGRLGMDEGTKIALVLGKGKVY